MKLVIAGGSGHLGRLVATDWHRQGHEVIVLSRRAGHDPWSTQVWDGVSPGNWCRALEGADAVLNLAGRSVDCRYHQKNRRLIMDSRIHSTAAIGKAIHAASQPPPLWLQMSTATIYAHTYHREMTESGGILGGKEPNAPDTWRFSIDVAKAWEAEGLKWARPQTRLVLLRTAMVMSPWHQSVLPILTKLVRRRLGGPAGHGRQFISWIHYFDFLNALQFIAANPDLSGPVNISAPNPLPNRDFMRELRLASGVGFGLPSPRWLLEIGAFLMRTESELLLKSRNVVPERLLDAGFQFRFPNWHSALQNLSSRSGGVSQIREIRDLLEQA